MLPFSVRTSGIVSGAVIAAVLLHRTWIAFSLRRRGLREPPGPPHRFLFANLFDIPLKDVHIGYARMAETYGPIMKLSTPTSTFVVLSTADVVEDLLDKQGAISSDRPPLRMAKLSGWSWAIGVMNYGPELRARRKIMHQYLDQRVIMQYSALIVQNALELAQRVLSTPEDFFKHTLSATGSAILQITYGIRVSGDNDPYVSLASNAMSAWAAAVTPGVWAVEWVPILEYLPSWFPGAYFKRYAEEQKQYPNNMLNLPFTHTRNEMARGSCSPCMVSESLSLNYDENVVKEAAGFAYLGGVDTAAAIMQSFLLAMTLNPAIQRAAQYQLDEVIGRDRLPTFADRKSLPYVEAIVLELYRMYPSAPLGLPHVLSADCVYDDMLLPEGTALIANIWGILRDPKVYHEPHTFRPERFLIDGRIDSTVPDPRAHIFGYGRRICPGQYLADASVFIQAAMLLSCFNISCKYENGVEITPSGEFHNSAFSAPMPFPCSIKPRFEKIEFLISRALDIST